MVRNCFGTDTENTSKMDAVQLADYTVKRFEMASTDSQYPAAVREQSKETAQMLRDLKASDPEAFERYGEGLKKDNATAHNKTFLYLGGVAYSGTNITSGSTPPANPHALKETVSMMVKDPENAEKILQSRYNRSYEDFDTPTESPEPIQAVVGAVVGVEDTAKPSGIVQEAPSAPRAPAVSRVSQPATPQTAAPRAAISAAVVGGVAASSAKAATIESLTNQGMVVTAGLKTPNSPGINNLMNGIGNIDLGSMFGKNGGDFMKGIKEFISGFMEKIASFFNKSDGVAVFGNDSNNNLVKTMANITGSNPNVTVVEPNGATRDMGPARDLGRTPTPEFDPEGMDKRKVGIPKLATPGFAMGGSG